MLLKFGQGEMLQQRRSSAEGGRLRLGAMQGALHYYLARPATSERGGADLQASPLPPTPMQYLVQLGRFPKCARDSLGRIASGFVQSTRAAFPADGQDSKYAVVFDARPEFDHLPLAFLVCSDPQSKVNGSSLIPHGENKACHV